MSKKKDEYEKNPYRCKQCNTSIPYNRYREKKKYKNHNPDFVFCGRKCRGVYVCLNKNSNIEKYCKGCRTIKPSFEFYFSNKEKTRLSVRCKKCHVLYCIFKDRTNREKINERKRAWSYGITIEQVRNLYSSQNGKCLICYDEATDIDHCHKTHKIRGMLCNKCNRGLGSFRDNIIYLENAIKYLTEREAK